jgi:hypothetical protein
MAILARVLLSSAAFSSAAFAADVTVEDEDLVRLPRHVAAAIRIHPTFSEFKADGCNDLVGKRVQLRAKGGGGWVATTANGCAWAAASAPIWVVHRRSRRNAVILRTDGYDVTVGRRTRNGLRHLAVAAGTTGWYSEQLLKYDGRKYVVARSLFVDKSNPADCRKHKDVCDQ